MNTKHNAGFPTEKTLCGVTLCGFAISAVANYVMVPALKAVFDLGHCHMGAVSLPNVFLTHVHKDHMAGLPVWFCLREMQGMDPGRVILPECDLDRMVALMESYDRLEGESTYNRRPQFLGVRNGDVVPLGKNNQVKVLDVTHRIPSVGYTVVETRRKLREDLQGKTSAEIMAAKARGEDINVVVTHPVFTYIGDSTIDTYLRHPEVGESDVLVIESTYIGNEDRPLAAKHGHTHLDELVDLWRTHPNTLGNKAIVLKHFSTRYDLADIYTTLAKLPEGLRERVTALLPSS
mgnify:FL=1